MRLLFLFIALRLAGSLEAQDAAGTLNIKTNKNVIQPGDSLAVTINYVIGTNQSRNPALATVELVIETEAGQRTRLRWPMINSQATGSLLLTDSLPRGKYTLSAGLQQR